MCLSLQSKSRRSKAGAQKVGFSERQNKVRAAVLDRVAAVRLSQLPKIWIGKKRQSAVAME